jgi:hypothetical protein
MKGTASAVPFFLSCQGHDSSNSLFQPGWPYYSYLALRYHYETAGPEADFFLLEYLANSPGEVLAVRGPETNKQDTVMRSWGKSSKVGKIQVLFDQESLVPLRRFPNVTVAPATQILFSNRVNIMLEAR